jgi:putative endopeptidase
VLPKAVDSEDFSLYGTLLSRTQEVPDRSKGAIAATNGALRQAVGQLYTQRFFSPEARAKAQAAAQFDACCSVSDLCAHGKQVPTENIAELAGLLAAHDADVLSRKGKSDVVIGGLSGKQLFLAFAQRWRTSQGEASLRRHILADAQAPREYRSDAVRNVEAWYEAYGVTPGDKLYLESEDRVEIW